MFEDESVRSGAPAALDRLSETELEARIGTLQAEIAACQAELARKRAVREAADALFRTPSAGSPD